MKALPKELPEPVKYEARKISEKWCDITANDVGLLTLNGWEVRALYSEASLTAETARADSLAAELERVKLERNRFRENIKDLADKKRVTAGFRDEFKRRAEAAEFKRRAEAAETRLALYRYIVSSAIAYGYPVSDEILAKLSEKAG